MDKFTLIIPTYSRSRFLKRLLRFLASENAGFPIFVMDSSPSELAEENQRVVAQFAKELQVHLFHSSSHFPPGENPLVHEKVQWALSMVKTPYVALCADDDFLIPSALAKCVEYLESSPAHCCARGRIYDFRVDRTTKQLDYLVSPLLPSIESSDARQRLWVASRHYQQTFYAVFRTSILIEIEQRLPKRLQGTPSWVDELAFTTLPAVFGKVARIDVPYEYRELHAENYGHKVPKWPEMLLESSHRPFIDDYIQTLTTALRDCSPDLSPEQAEQAVRGSLVAFTKFYFDVRYRDSHCMPCDAPKHQPHGARRPPVERILYRLGTFNKSASEKFTQFKTQKLPESRRIAQAVFEDDLGR